MSAPVDLDLFPRYTASRMRVLLIQPPFTQLNAPYPAIHYLDRFLRDRGHLTEVRDDSIGLYRRVMTRESVLKIFEDAEERLRRTSAPDPDTSAQLERYVSYRDRYAAWAEPLTRFLSSGDPSLAFRLSRVPDDLPRGLRVERFLDEREGTISPEEAPALAVRILDDLGDFIAYSLDQNFGTVRYAERIASSHARLRPISEAAESGYLMRNFYRPWLRSSFSAEAGSSSPDLLLITVPFPGCLVGALAASREARAAFGSRLRVALGGGYVSTELRDLKDAALFDDADYLCFDAGYGALTSLMERMEAEQSGRSAPSPYRTAFRAPDGKVVYSGFPSDDHHGGQDDGDRFAALEEESLRTVFPDYRNADLTRYVRAPSSENPMHRIWSDAPWLKYQLAYGCYWHRCAFCDTQLDYVRHYLPSDVPALMAAADEAAARSGLYGIHFTDEALPLPCLMEFARLNRARRNPFAFWGNVRFDRVWTEDRCSLLAASGFIAASGGIEIATERGLAMTGKGFTFSELVRSLIAFKRNGILVHGYLIYGFPEQTEQDLTDSAEAVRQLFAAGLLDSAFWHRFVLTRHSEMYANWRSGRMPGLEPVEREGSFADNDLEFRGSERWNPFDEPLERLLSEWMAGEGLSEPIRPLRSGGPKPSVDPDWVESLAEAADSQPYEYDPPVSRARAHWIAGLPIVKAPTAGTKDGIKEKNKTDRNPRANDRALARIEWTDRGAPAGLALPPTAAARLAEAITELAENPDGRPLPAFLERAGIPEATRTSSVPSASESDRAVFAALRGNGLVVT